MELSDKESKLEELVSIIIPAYNCEEFVGATIKSILSQKYSNWEAIFVDDCSTDKTKEIIEKFAQADSRIQYHRLDKNSGAAIARNKAIDIAKGKFLAFLDSDDIWSPEKLLKQISFMEYNKYTFTCTNYSKIDKDGEAVNNEVIYSERKVDYNNLLKNCPGNSTVIYNAEVLGKFKIPNIKKRNDYLMWLQVIKKADYLYGLDVTLGSHRIRNESLSSKKSDLVKYHWKVYRKYEKLSFIKSGYLIFYWIKKSLIK